MIQWSDDTLFGHPKGLFVLFLTEMWERFSYYGMRALLVYYMMKHLMFTQGKLHKYMACTRASCISPPFSEVFSLTVSWVNAGR